jgi:PAS domain S-box-containing protein
MKLIQNSTVNHRIRHAPGKTTFQTKMQYLKKLLLGNGHDFKTVSEKRRTILTSQLSLFCIILSLFQISFEIYSESNSTILLYSLLLLFSIGSILMNRLRRYDAAKLLFLIGLNLVIFISCEIENAENGTFLFFVVAILTAYALLGFTRKSMVIGLSIFSVSLFLLSFYYDFTYIPHAVMPESVVAGSFIFKFMVSSVATILIILFLSDINIKSENSLRSVSEELLSNQQRFELAVEGSSASIWDWDIKSDSLFVSPLLFKLLDNTRNTKEITLDGFLQVIHIDDKKRVKSALNNHLEYGVPFSVEFRIRKKDGTYIWIYDTGQAVWDNDGKAIRMVGSVVDITERKMTESLILEKNIQLKKTNEELDKFVYSTSHDLRAPLSSFLGLINIAELTEDPIELNKCLSFMKQRINTLHGFIDDIVDYSRNNRLDVEVAEVSLHDMVDDILINLEYSANQKNIKIHKEFPINFTLYSDKTRLRAILNNLLTNAIIYHNIDQEHPFIKIRATATNNYIQIDIEDNGRGIDRAYIQSIFNMFYRASEDSEGSGLGLYIAQEMTQKLLGQLTVNSMIGQGSTFSLILPTAINLTIGDMRESRAFA